jgi:hypothetical protein
MHEVVERQDIKILADNFIAGLGLSKKVLKKNKFGCFPYVSRLILNL